MKNYHSSESRTVTHPLLGLNINEQNLHVHTWKVVTTPRPGGVKDKRTHSNKL